MTFQLTTKIIFSLTRERYPVSRSDAAVFVLVVVRGGCRWLTGARFTFLHNSLKVILPAPRPIRCITACRERKANESNRKQERKMRGRKIADAAVVARCMRGNFFYVTAEPVAASREKNDAKSTTRRWWCIAAAKQQRRTRHWTWNVRDQLQHPIDIIYNNSSLCVVVFCGAYTLTINREELFSCHSVRACHTTRHILIRMIMTT